MIIAAMTIGTLLLCPQVTPPPVGAPQAAEVDTQEAAQWARIMALDGGSPIRATLTPPKYLLERGFLSPDGAQRRPGDRRLDGRFIAADADTLVLRVVSGGEEGVWRIPRAAIARVEEVHVTLDRTADGYLKGLALGAGLGLVTYAGFHGTSEAFDVDELPYLMAFYGVPASLLGWLVDSTNRGESFTPAATLYGEPTRGSGAEHPSPSVPAARRFTAGAGVALGLSGTGRRAGNGSAYALSSTRPLEPKLELELQVLASLDRRETRDGRAFYYLDDNDEATEVVARRTSRSDDAIALVRLNYVFAGERVRPYVSTGVGLGWSRLEDASVAYLPDGEEFSSRYRTDSGIGLAMLIGGGLDIGLSRRWRLRPELTWHGVTRSGSGGAAVTVGVSYCPGGGGE